MLTLRTGRLTIFSLNRVQMRCLLAGMAVLEQELHLNPSGHVLEAHTQEAMRMLYELGEGKAADCPWGTNWQIIDTEHKISIGSACFMGEPDASGEVEVGYGINPEYRGQGIMTEALEAMSAWALHQPGVMAVRAECEADNPASQRVLEKCGFIATNSDRTCWKRGVLQ